MFRQTATSKSLIRSGGRPMRALRKQPLDNVLPFEKPSNFRIERIDNLEFMRSLQNESIHLIVTSPPYNLGKTYEKKTPNDVYIEQQSATIAEAFRILHPRG